MGTLSGIAVLGAGTMGHGIAQLAAQAGLEVTIYDVEDKFLKAGMEKIRWSLSKLVEKKTISQAEAESTISRIRTSLRLDEAVRDKTFVIEAVPEDLELKRRVFKQLDELCPKSAVLASNTSTLPITSIAEVTKRPEMVVGMHFFNPPQLMPLVEVIRGRSTGNEAVETAAELARKMKKEVVVCNLDVPGFIVNRIFGPLIQEAGWTVYRKEAEVVEVDSAMKYKVGLPMGPFELADYSGIDVVYLAAEAVRKIDGSVIVCPIFKEYFEKKWFGTKTGRGFYEYKGEQWERPQIPRDAGERVRPEEIFAPAMNSAAWLIRNNVCSREDLDKAMKLGLGFPEGILQMADKWGIDTIVRILDEKAKKHGDFYRADPLLQQMVEKGALGQKTGKGFYDYAGAEKPFEEIILAKEPPLAWITLNRPHRLNTITPKMIDEVNSVLSQLWDDSETRVLIIKGSGERAFSAGFDVTVFTETNPTAVFENTRKFQNALSRLENFPKPVIASIDGYALGGGCEMILACDFRIASDRAEIGQPEIKLGLIPGGGGTQRLARIIGPAKTKEIVMLGERITSQEALRIGLVNVVVPADRLEAETRTMAEKLAQGPPIALKLAKYAINAATETPLEAGLSMEASSFANLFSTSDLVEGVSAFLSKRKPKFAGK